DILLVGDADHQHPRAAGRPPGMLAQRRHRLLDHAARHRRVDLAGQLDEAGGDVVFARLPGQVERVDRDAVAAEPRARVERHVAEGFGLGRLDHLPDVDAIASNTILSSLTRAMLTERKMFSVSLTASAASSDDTGTVRATIWSYSAQARRCAVSPSPPTTLGMSPVAKSALPGSSRSGE